MFLSALPRLLHGETRSLPCSAPWALLPLGKSKSPGVWVRSMGRAGTQRMGERHLGGPARADRAGRAPRGVGVLGGGSQAPALGRGDAGAVEVVHTCTMEVSSRTECGFIAWSPAGSQRARCRAGLYYKPVNNSVLDGLLKELIYPGLFANLGSKLGCSCVRLSLSCFIIPAKFALRPHSLYPVMGLVG